MRLLLLAKHAYDDVFGTVSQIWSVVHAESVDEALSMLRHEAFDLVILDTAALGEDGFGFIRRLRMARNDTPVLVLTSDQVDDRTRALKLGADEAIAQSISVEEVHARITAVIRRSKGYSRSVIQVGDLSLCLETHEVRLRDKPIHLTGKEYAVLQLLMLRKDMIITKEMLLNHLYGGGLDEPEIKIIDVFICKIRRRLDKAGLADVIHTVWGQGYIIRDISRLRQPNRAAAIGNSRDKLVA